MLYEVITTPVEGYFEHLALDDAAVPSFVIEQGPIIEDVFDNEPGFTDGNIGGFAQAADDARAVIDYMHRWPVPPDYATRITSYNVCYTKLLRWCSPSSPASSPACSSSVITSYSIHYTKLYDAEVLEQQAAAGRTDAGDIFQLRVQGGLGAQLAMAGDSYNFV